MSTAGNQKKKKRTQHIYVYSTCFDSILRILKSAEYVYTEKSYFRIESDERIQENSEILQNKNKFLFSYLNN